MQFQSVNMPSRWQRLLRVAILGSIPASVPTVSLGGTFATDVQLHLYASFGGSLSLHDASYIFERRVFSPPNGFNEGFLSQGSVSVELPKPPTDPLTGPFNVKSLATLHAGVIVKGTWGVISSTSPRAEASTSASYQDLIEIVPAPPLGDTSLHVTAELFGIVYASGQLNGASADMSLLLYSPDHPTFNGQAVGGLKEIHDEPGTDRDYTNGVASADLPLSRAGGRAFLSVGLQLSAEARAIDGSAIANALHTALLTSIRFQSGVTPEELGYQLEFASGSQSPNLVILPEAPAVIQAIAGAIGMIFVCYRNRSRFAKLDAAN